MIEEKDRKFLQLRPWQLYHILVKLLGGEKLANIQRLDAPHEYYQFLPGVKTPGGRTENFVFSGWVGAYVWFGLWGTASEAANWRKLVVQYLKRMRTVGHMGGEQCCPDPHHGMHLGAVGVARLAALYFGHKDVLEWTSKYYSDHLVIGELCCDDTYEVRAPGLRNKFNPPRQELWTWFVRAMNDIKQRRPKDDPYYTGALAVRTLDEGWGIDIDRDESMDNCMLKYPMEVQRSRNGYLAKIYTGGVPVKQGVYWVKVDSGGEPEFGFDIEAAVPELEGVEHTIRIKSPQLRSR